jgi:hypothetical protein
MTLRLDEALLESLATLMTPYATPFLRSPRSVTM